MSVLEPMEMEAAQEWPPFMAGADEPSAVPDVPPFEFERQQTEERLGITHEEVLDRVMERFEKSKKAKRGREMTWWLCLCFYLDDHYAKWEKDSLIPGEARKGVPRHRVQAFVNFIEQGALESAARLTRPNRTLSCSPLTENPEDIDRATLGDAALKSEWRRLRLTLKDHEAEMWCSLTGTSGKWTRWDPSSGPLNEQGMPRGENDVEVLSPFDIYPDPAGARFRSMRHCQIAVEANVDALRDDFPDLAEKIQPSSLRDEAQGYDRQIKAKASASLGPQDEDAQKGDTATLIYHYEPRTPSMPNGLMAIAVDGCVLWMDENPWAHFGDTREEWCPLEIDRFSEVPNSFWGKGPVESAIPIQKQFNRTLSQVIEQRNETGNPRWFTFSGMKVNWSQWKNEPGEIVTITPPRAEWNYQGKILFPHRVDPLPIPSSMFKLLSDLKAEIEDVFAYHQVSKGGAPPGVRAGNAIEALQETDQARSGPIIIRHNLGWEAVGRRLLTLVRDQWDDGRLIRVRGDDGFDEVVSFRGDGLPSDLTVDVDSDMMLPTTRQGRLQMLLQLVQAGALTPMEAREAIFGGYGTIRAAIYKASVSHRKQMRENRKMALGMPVEVSNFDKHQIHLTVLNNWRESASYERVSGEQVQLMTPMGPMPVTVKDIVEMHAQGHVRALLAQVPPGMAQGPEGATGPGGQSGPNNPEQGGNPADAGGQGMSRGAAPDFAGAM